MGIFLSECPHLEQPPLIPAVVEGEDDFFRGGAEVFGVFVGGEIFAEGGEDVLDAVGVAGFPDDAEEGELEFVLEAFEAAVVIDEVEEGFLGIADEDGEVEGDAEQLAEGGAAVFLGVEVGFGVAEFGVGIKIAFAVLVEVEQGGAAEHVLDDAVEIANEATGEELCLAWTMNFPEAGAMVLGKEVAVPSDLASFPPSGPGANDVMPMPSSSRQIRTTRCSNSVSLRSWRGKRGMGGMNRCGAALWQRRCLTSEDYLELLSRGRQE
jgi:hypothetical protein